MNKNVNAAAAEVIEKLAPEEMFLLSEFDPSKANSGSASRGPLGIGLEATVALLLPVVWKVIESLFSDVAEELKKEVAKTFVQQLKRFWERRASAEEPPDELVKEVADRLLSEGVDLSKHPSLAQVIATSFVKHYGNGRNK